MLERFVFNCKKKEREIVFLSICHVDETPGHSAVLFYTRRLWEGSKMTLVKPAPARVCSKKAYHYYLLLLCSACIRPCRLLSNNLCVSEQARFHSSPAQYFISLRGGEMSEKEGKRQTNQFERPDKCNKPKVYFSAPSKWVLRYCITLFM